MAIPDNVRPITPTDEYLREVTGQVALQGVSGAAQLETIIAKLTQIHRLLKKIAGEKGVDGELVEP